ncbi:hypothetical protein [Bradyrhizobium iriomotense]|uniref:DUF4132 domain-containing protein n=1 Tax=Bradyrhizobium iriomotense TaxID=441950 RepID=A0ABQ6B7Z0_9BRAD|nr:hypothetical protein [Bradyrhizobium iriomotense]GLR89790.1 hypothetical protein GCM10007857_65040 [Bradyrhizobium iriomotense]
MVEATKKITPADVSEFERDRLRFFLTGDDALTNLTEINPSLAWLPLLAEMKVFQNDTVLPAWIERNFADIEAVREVVNNLRFFDAEAARILKYRLEAQRGKLDPLLVKCWQLIIRHIENDHQGRTYGQWFGLLPRLRHGDVSAEVLSRLIHLLTPKLFVEKRYGWYEDADRSIEKPTDIMSIKYGVEDGITEKDFIAAWPKNAGAEEMAFLVDGLTTALSATLADATEVGVEGAIGLSLTDIDVPSVAAHQQNAHHEGFLPTVRVLAELWSRLVENDLDKALHTLDVWKRSSFRLLHRLALYAAGDSRVSPDLAADVLLAIPQGELFLTNSQVEVHRLIRSRWPEFSDAERGAIERRIVVGPPADWFKDGVDLAEPMDRHRFALLLDLEGSNVPLGSEAAKLLTEIRQRRPNWIDNDPERAGFAIWHGEGRSLEGKKEKLQGVPSSELVAAAKKAAAEADFMDGDAWQSFCQAQPDEAFLGIEAASDPDRWQEWVWRPLLWAANKISDVALLNRMASLLAAWPEDSPFAETANGAAFWMDQVSDKLKSAVLWKLWDLIERRAPRPSEKPDGDIFTAALNDPAGNLASVLLKKTPKSRGQVELGKALRGRYVRLLSGNDFFALLARVRFSAAVAFLFERAPAWTEANILPSYEWTSPDAVAMWSARKYANHIGSARLFSLTKKPFLELFSRQEMGREDNRAFSDWLAIILVVNQAKKAEYPLTTTEVRSVLRATGNEGRWSFAHQLAVEMEAAQPAEKISVWREIIGPVFERAWPLDAELQSPRTTFKLVQLLLATGDAFGEAAPIVIPFIRPEEARAHSSVFSISEADPEIYKVAPEQMLNLLSAVAGDAANQSLYGMNKALEKLEQTAPGLMETKAFQKLKMQAMTL